MLSAPVVRRFLRARSARVIPPLALPCAAVVLPAVVLAAVVLLLAASPLPAQQRNAFSRVQVRWPDVRVWLSDSCDGQPHYPAHVDSLRLLEDGRTITGAVMSCPEPGRQQTAVTALVFDASGSMMGAGNEQARAGCVAFADSMIDGDAAAVLWFNGTTTIEQALTSDRAAVRAAADRIPAGGSTAVWDAIYAGLLELIGAPAHPVRLVIAMTDGGDGGSSRTPSEIIALANLHGIRVFTIGIGSSLDRTQLELIAILTGGVYYSAINAPMIPPAMLDAQRRARDAFRECEIRYTAPGCADGALHSVSVEFTDGCGTAAAGTRTWRAPLDTASWTRVTPAAQQLAVTEEDTLALPLHWPGDPSLTSFGTASAVLRFDTLALRLLAVDTSGTAMLRGSTITVTPRLDGAALVISPQPVAGAGLLATLRFLAKRLPGTSPRRTTVGLRDWRLTGSCLLYAPEDVPVDVSVAAPVDIEGRTAFCDGDSAALTASATLREIRWNTGDTTRRIVVRTEGVYAYTGIDGSGRQRRSHDIPVRVSTLAPFPVTQSRRLCDGDSVRLSAPAGFAVYRWSTGAGTRTITVSAPGSYWLTGIDDLGCERVSDVLDLVRHTPVRPVITRDGMALTAHPPAVLFEWWWNGTRVPGEYSQRLPLSATGTYVVRSVDSNGCSAVSAPFDVLTLRAGDVPAAAVRTLAVHPDPSAGRVTVTTDALPADAMELAVYDMLGTRLWHTAGTHPGGAFTRTVELTGRGPRLIRLHCGAVTLQRLILSLARER